MDEVSWIPERKIIAAAVATIIVFVADVAFGADIPPGVEGALAVIVGYFIPNAA